MKLIPLNLATFKKIGEGLANYLQKNLTLNITIKLLHMKVKFYTLFFVLFAQSVLMAQVCQPDKMYKDSSAGVYPKPSVGIDKKACINTPYEYIFTVVVPATIVFNGFEIGIDYVRMDTVNAVDSLPKGISYKCNPPNCTFNKNTQGCIVLSGTPTAVNLAPYNYNLKIRAEAFAPGLGALPIEFPGALFPGNYYLRVLKEGNDSCKIVGNSELLPNDLQATVKPNPFTGQTTVSYTLPAQAQLTFTVFNSLGQVVSTRKLEAFAGENTLPFEAENLDGWYYFSLQTESLKSVGKFLVIK